MTPAEKWTLVAAISCIAVFAVAGSLVLPTLTLLLEARGVSPALIGLLGAELGIMTLIAAPVAPLLVRRLGAARALCASLIIVACATLSYKFFESYVAAWFLIYAFASCGLALIFVIAETMITALAPPGKSGRILALYAMFFSLGFAVGPLILRFTGIEGWAPFLIAAALTAAAAVIAATAKLPPGAAPAPPKAGFWRLFPIAPVPFVCSFALGAAEMSIYDLLPVYARKMGVDVAGAVSLLTVFSVGTAVTLPLAGVIADKIGDRRTLAGAAAIGIFGALLLPLLIDDGGAFDFASAAFWIKAGTLGIWGGALMAIYPIGLVIVKRTFQPAQLAAANALFGFSYGGGALCGPALTGLGMTVSPLAFSPVVAAFAALPLIAMRLARP